MIGLWFRLAAAVAAQVRAGHGVPRRNQQGCHSMPGGASAGVAVQQNDGGAGTTVPHPQLELADVDPFLGEPLEHAPPRYEVRGVSTAIW